MSDSSADPGLKQSQLRYLGLLLLAVVVLLAVAFGPPPVSNPTVSVGWVAMAVAGASIALGGTVAELSVGPARVSWRHLVGAGFGLFGVSLPVAYVRTMEGDPLAGSDLLVLAPGVVSGLVFLAVAIDVAREGGNFRVLPDVDRRI